LWIRSTNPSPYLRQVVSFTNEEQTDRDAIYGSEWKGETEGMLELRDRVFANCNKSEEDGTKWKELNIRGKSTAEKLLEIEIKRLIPHAKVYSSRAKRSRSGNDQIKLMAATAATPIFLFVNQLEATEIEFQKKVCCKNNDSKLRFYPSVIPRSSQRQCESILFLTFWAVVCVAYARNCWKRLLPAFPHKWRPCHSGGMEADKIQVLP